MAVSNLLYPDGEVEFYDVVVNREVVLQDILLEHMGFENQREREKHEQVG